MIIIRIFQLPCWILFITCSFINAEFQPFLWGVATAAYQIEGGTNMDGRGPSIWDDFSKIVGKIKNGDNGDYADGSYERFREDIKLMKNMNVKSYRFSISWSRIMPTGQYPINQEGIDHYKSLLKELKAANIEPLVTLYHWDLPSNLHNKYGGWLSPHIEFDFLAYADVCFREFGHLVKLWTTMNEPWTFCYLGYGSGIFAPGRCSDRSTCPEGDSSTEAYLAAHNVLNSHAAAVELYRTKYQSNQKGLIGMTLNQDWAEPLTSDPLDIAAAERRNEFLIGWFADPIVFGKYPQSMIDRIGDRLPTFTTEQSARLKGSYDFYGLNHYTSKYFSRSTFTTPYDSDSNTTTNSNSNGTTTLSSNITNVAGVGWATDQGNKEHRYDLNGVIIGPQAASPWLNVVPWGFYKMLMWNHNRYVNDKL